MAKYYIGLANTFHDSALAIVDPLGDVIFAEATERFLQSKHALNCLPDRREIISRIIKQYCPQGSDFVVATTWSETVHLSFKRRYFLGLLEDKISISTTEEEIAMKCLELKIGWYVDAGFLLLYMMEQTGRELYRFIVENYQNSRVEFVDCVHHLTHAAHSCYSSPFDECVCVVIDGYGEGGSLSYFHYQEGRLKQIKQVDGPVSLGILYFVCTHFCGFDPVKGEEWKVMGLAPYGQLNEELYTLFKALLNVEELEIKYSSKQHLKNLVAKLAAMARPKGTSPLTVADLAYTVQFVYSETVTEVLNNFYQLGLSENLVLSGGCALNSAYNGQILNQTPFKHLHVPSAPADDGNAIGAALLAYYGDRPQEIRTPKLQLPYLGSAISPESLERLKTFGNLPKMRQLPLQDIYTETADLLARGKLLGWVQGRAEFGPRALGNRSILAAPHPGSMKDKINSLVKFREEFRPFAPSILHEFGPEYFEHYQESPYMERALKFRDNVVDKVPAVVHVNQTGRLQSVKKEWNERFYNLIKAFHDLTGIPLLLNTSFNIMGKPIVHSLEDAISVFFTTGLDALVIEDYLIEK